MPQVTASFQLFNMDGLCVKINLTGETEAPASWLDGQLAQFQKAGYRNEPVEGSLKPQTIPIVGYVRTSSQDPQNPGQYKPALALFSPWGDFTAITVYAEKLPDLPFEPKGKVWDGGAFDRNLVAGKGYLTKCDMKIVKEPIIDYEGKPKLTEAGNQKWRFVRVAELDGKPVGEPSEQKPVEQQEVTSKQEPADKDLEAKKALIGRVAQTAKQVYGEAGRSAAMLKIGKMIANNEELKGLTALTMSQLEKVAALIELDAVGTVEYGNANDWYDAIPVLLTEYGKETVYDLTTAQLNRMRTDIKKSVVKDIPF